MKYKHIQQNRQNLKAIIITGSHDFGRCPIASRLPTALWPITGKTALENLLQHLMRAGIKDITICSNGLAAVLKQAIKTELSEFVTFLGDRLPVGTAGCIRDSIGTDSNNTSLLLVFAGAVIDPPEIDSLIKAHTQSQSDLTIFLNPLNNSPEAYYESACIYACEPAILEYIPNQGYYDIKESLVPALLAAGKNVSSVRLSKPAGNFRNHQQYLTAITEYLQTCNNKAFDLPIVKHNGKQKLWAGPECKIDPTAQICGAVVIMEKANIAQNAVILGPTIIGRQVSIGPNTLIANSVIWDFAGVSKNCQINKCVIDSGTSVAANTCLEEKAVPHRPKTILQNTLNRVAGVINSKVDRISKITANRFPKINKFLEQPNAKNIPSKALFRLTVILLPIVFLWSYWPNIIDLWDIWQRSDEYSSGLLVPFLAGYIIWARREQLADCPIKPSLWGLAALLLALSLRYFGLFFMYGSAERLSVVATIAALVLLLLGWQVFKKVLTTLIFLGLMLPLPRTLHARIMLPLQSWATSSAVFCLEVLGYNVIREGNIIHLNGSTVAVAEACNGLRMVMAFVIISSLVVLLIKKRWWEKLFLLLSSIPIALICNCIRLTITAIAFTFLSGQNWEKIFHDFGGYAMMPLALGIIVLELKIMQKLITVAPETKTVLPTKPSR